MNTILILLVLVGFFALKQKSEQTRNILLVVLTLLCFCMFSVEGIYGEVADLNVVAPAMATVITHNTFPNGIEQLWYGGDGHTGTLQNTGYAVVVSDTLDAMRMSTNSPPTNCPAETNTPNWLVNNITGMAAAVTPAAFQRVVAGDWNTASPPQVPVTDDDSWSDLLKNGNPQAGWSAHPTDPSYGSVYWSYPTLPRIKPVTYNGNVGTRDSVRQNTLGTERYKVMSEDGNTAFWISDSVKAYSIDANGRDRGPTGIQCDGIVKYNATAPPLDYATIGEVFSCEPGIQIEGIPDRRPPVPIDFYFSEPPINPTALNVPITADSSTPITNDMLLKSGIMPDGMFSPGSGGGVGMAVMTGQVDLLTGESAIPIISPTPNPCNDILVADGLPPIFVNRSSAEGTDITVFGSKNRYIIGNAYSADNWKETDDHLRGFNLAPTIAANINLDGTSPILDITCKVGKRTGDEDQDDATPFLETMVDYSEAGKTILQNPNAFIRNTDINRDMDNILTCTVPCNGVPDNGGPDTQSTTHCQVGTRPIDEYNTTWYEPNSGESFVDPDTYNVTNDSNFQETCCIKCEPNDYCTLQTCPTGPGDGSCPSGKFKQLSSSSATIDTYTGRLGGEDYKKKCCVKENACSSTPDTQEKELCTDHGKVYKENILDETYEGELGNKSFIESCCQEPACQSGQQSCSQWGIWSDITGRIDGPLCKKGLFFDTYCQETTVSGIYASLIHDETDGATGYA